MNEEQGHNVELPTQQKPGWEQQLSTVTPFSKYLAMALFVVLPFLGFYLGVSYGNLGTARISVPNDTFTVRTPSDNIDSVGAGASLPQESNVKDERTGWLTSVSGAGEERQISIDYTKKITCDYTVITPEECTYPYRLIDEDGSQTFSFPVAEDAVVTMQTLHHGADGNFKWNDVISWDTFLQATEIGDNGYSRYLISPEEVVQEGGVNDGSLFRVTVRDGVITEITEMYLP
jgi:hypothetical protein